MPSSSIPPSDNLAYNITLHSVLHIRGLYLGHLLELVRLVVTPRLPRRSSPRPLVGQLLAP